VSRSRTQTILALIAVGVGVLFAAILGLHTYMRATAMPLHPDTQNVPSVTHSKFRERRIVVAVTSNISYADTFAIALRIAEAFSPDHPRM
jgi:NO-binding membrane sensor protein with MHYT domain